MASYQVNAVYLACLFEYVDEVRQFDQIEPPLEIILDLPLKVQGPVVQSVVSLTSSLVVKLLTVLVSTISNSQVFLLKKCE